MDVERFGLPPSLMSAQMNRGENRMKRVILTIVSSAILMMAMAGAAIAEPPGAAPGTGLTGACNMLLDPTMTTIPMVRDAPQGNAGMFHAVAVSGCS